MSMRAAIIRVLECSGPKNMLGIVKAVCDHDDFRYNDLPGVLHYLIRDGRVAVDCGIYSLKK